MVIAIDARPLVARFRRCVSRTKMGEDARKELSRASFQSPEGELPMLGENRESERERE